MSSPYRVCLLCLTIMLFLVVRPLLSFYQSSPVETESNRTIVMRGMPVTLQLEVRADTLPTITWRVNGAAISVNDSNYEIGSIIEEERGDDHFYMVRINVMHAHMTLCVCVCVCVCMCGLKLLPANPSNLILIWGSWLYM